MALDKIQAWKAAIVAFLASVERAQKQVEPAIASWAERGESRLARAAQTSTVIQGVVIVIVASVGVVIVDSIDGAFASPSNTSLSSSQEGLLDGFASMIDLIEPLLIILIAVVVIAVVQRIQS